MYSDNRSASVIGFLSVEDSPGADSRLRELRGLGGKRVGARSGGLRSDQHFQPGNPLVEVRDGVRGSLKPGEPALQRKPVFGDLLSLLLQANLLSGSGS